MPGGEDGRNDNGMWSRGEVQRSILRLERNMQDDIMRIRQRQDDHEKVHVSKEAFDSLRITLRGVAFILLVQVLATLGGLIYYAITRGHG